MINIIKNRRIFYIISILVIVPGLVSLVFFGLKLAIDFTGGSRIEVGYKENLEKSKVEKILSDNKVKFHSLNKVDKDTFSIRMGIVDPKTKAKIIESLKKQYPKIKEESFDTVGPTIGQETQANAFKAVVIASIAITAYIAFAFRKVSEPVVSWKYGVCAIIALLHDVLIVAGVFSILGVLFNVEVDALFITALLTVMGFSVHDTIVVFDRIRENLNKNFNAPFDVVVNNSLLETFNRSLNTSLTVVIILFTLLLFGGESIRWFIVALLVGVVSGTYSSIFNASPLLVSWNEWNKKRKN